MEESAAVVTVTCVTIRDAIGDLLRTTQGAPDRDAVAAAMRESGVDDVDSALVDTVIGHFADTATIDDADALADLAVEACLIPFDPAIDRIPSDHISSDAVSPELEHPVADPPLPVHDVDPMHEFDLDAHGNDLAAPEPNRTGPDELEPNEVRSVDHPEPIAAFGDGAADGPVDEERDAETIDPSTVIDMASTSMRDWTETPAVDASSPFAADFDADDHASETFDVHRESDTEVDDATVAGSDADPAWFDGFE